MFQTFLILQIYHIKNPNANNESIKISTENRQFATDLFKKLGTNFATDKVYGHSFENLYGQILGSIRLEKMNFLEIGLGCDMPKGPGWSIPVWKEFLPNATISMLEYDGTCAKQFESQVEHLFIGDQSDLSFLKNIGENYGPFDVVVDDGGHSRKMQLYSLMGMWPFIHQNGVYVIEDIFTSFMPNTDFFFFNDHNTTVIDLILELIIILNIPPVSKPHILPNIPLSKDALKISQDLISINCFKHACALIKK